MVVGYDSFKCLELGPLTFLANTSPLTCKSALNNCVH